jgi:predicted hydrocarbon binding protein
MKEKFKKIMKIKGETRGVVLKTDEEFILREKGEEGLKKIEKELKRFGYPIKYKEITNMAYYPVGLRILSLLAIKKVFNFSEKEIRKMGADAPKISLIIKFFMQYFLSLQKTLKEISKIWRKHYTVGELIVVESNEEKKFIILRLKDFNLHPIICFYLAGYFSTVLKMIVKKPVFCQETKCFFRGDKYHEYLFKW